MDKKKLLWSILFLAIAGFTIWTVAEQSKYFSFTELREFLQMADKRWMCLAFCCMFGYIWFEGFAVIRIVKTLGYRKCVAQGTLYGAADVYFSAITPSASGGQPASAFFMLRDGIPGTVVTVTLLANSIMYTLALLCIGVVCMLLRFDLFLDFSLISRIFIGIGCIVLTGLSLGFYLALRKENLLFRICEHTLSLCEKLHWIKHAEKKRKKLMKSMQEYHACAAMITGHRTMLLEVLFWNICQRISQFGVSFMVFRSMGYSVKTAARIWVIQSYVSMGSNCVPIPGSMGVADYLMVDGFTKTIGAEYASYMELICRSISFYGCVLFSIVIVLIGYVVGKRKRY